MKVDGTYGLTFTYSVFTRQHDRPSTYDRINRVVLGYDQKLHRDDREHAKSRGLVVNDEVIEITQVLTQ